MKIAAVVVTYNRLKVLKECIEAIRKQTYQLDKIFVINNSSTDGTEVWLPEQHDLTVITQPNSGGAGGFHTGMKKAYEDGYDWIWLMDDDCLPNKDALANLLKGELYPSCVYNSLSVSDDLRSLSFYLYDNVVSSLIKTVNHTKNLNVINDAAFFNGTLISKQMVKETGFPIKKLFVRGDEVEYKLRILKNNKVLTKPESIIIHPKEILKEINFLGISHIYIQMSAMKKFYYHRNSVFIYKKYKHKNIIGIIKNMIFDALTALFIFKEFNVVISIIKGFINGIYFNPVNK